MSLSNTYETTILTWLLSTSTATRPTAWYLALFTTAPTDGTAGTEVTGGSYARQAVTMTISGGAASNSAAIEWPAASASWGTVVAAALMDASTGGNIIAYGDLTASKAVGSGDVFRFPLGDFDLTLD